MPSAHTCEGADWAPALAWDGAPQATKSFALIVDDPDVPDPKAPKTTWVHWVAYNLPATSTSLSEGGQLPAGGRDGLNDWKRPGYNGPCPPVGRHRYFFKLYALDTELAGFRQYRPRRCSKRRWRATCWPRAELVGTYQKQRRADRSEDRIGTVLR